MPFYGIIMELRYFRTSREQTTNNVMAHRFVTPGQSRLFLAIRLPEVVKADLAAALAPFKDQKGISVTRTENLHITVHFFGNIDDERVTSLIQTIDSNLQDISTFTLKLDQLVIYPPRRPRMIWASFEHSDQFEELASRFQRSAAEGIHPGDAKEQKPHVTCARFQHFKKMSVPMPFIEPRTITIDQIELWKTLPGKGGVEYSSIASFQLNAPS